MKKALSVILALLMVLTLVPAAQSVAAQTVAITKGDTSIWAYIATDSGTARDSAMVFYKGETTNTETNTYATLAEALDAAFASYQTAYTSVTPTTKEMIFQNQDFVFTAPYTRVCAENQTARFNMNGFKWSYRPLLQEHYDTPAFASPNGRLLITTGAADNDSRIFTSYQDTPFFSNRNRDKVLGFQASIINGDLDTGTARLQFLNGCTVNGNLKSSLPYNRGYIYVHGGVEINGNLYLSTLIQIYGGFTVNGDFISSGRIQVAPAGSLTVTGDVECVGARNTSAGTVYTAFSDTQNNTVNIGGNFKAVGVMETAELVKTVNSVTIGGQAVFEEPSAAMTLTKFTAKKGIVNNTTTSAEITCDSTCSFGSRFIFEDSISEDVVTAYGTAIKAPAGDWMDAAGAAIDFSSVTQGIEYVSYYKSLIIKYRVSLDGVETLVESGTDYTFPPLSQDGIAYTDGTDYYDAGDKVRITKAMSFTTVELAISMLYGASMRLKDISGMRFYTNVDIQAIADFRSQGVTVEMGTLIAPKDLLSGAELTHAINEANRLDVRYGASGYYSDSSFGFEGVVGSIGNIKDKNANREFIGRGYVRLTFGLKTFTKYAAYADGDIANNTRKVSWVAKYLKENDTAEYNSLSANAKSVVDKYAGMYIA